MDNKIFDWNKEKNKTLIKQRNISFEEVVFAIKQGKVIEIIDNPSSNFDNQSCYVLDINDYVYIVPFVKDGDKYFLKTIYPSRKYNKIYKKNK